MKRHAMQSKKAMRIHPFFSQQRNPITWVQELPSVIIARTDTSEFRSSRIAAFDLDGTLIKTKSGRVHSKDSGDWQWWHKDIPTTMQKLQDDGYGIVIFSNQNGLNTDQRLKSFKTKIQDILGQLPMNIWFMASLEKDQYRKPMTGMWEWFETVANHGNTVDFDKSFYVGDAAGRPDQWKEGLKKDHSAADRKFAANTGLTFYTPEEYFLKEAPAQYSWGSFSPQDYLHPLPLFTPTSSPLVPVTPTIEVIVFVGYPASGKSKFATTYLTPKGYVYVNQDTLRTKEKCIAACEKALKDKKPVIIDNTNPNAASRAPYIKLAAEAGVPVRCFRFTADEHLARHNNMYRAVHDSDSGRQVLSDVVFRTFKARLQEPTLSEGFKEIKHINFRFDGSSLEKAKWSKWMI
ncbi:bifunctional polynucleotide phosphatase kinase-like [Lichtheimia corymbifera JMRC:FSU:9682]|uniref:Bifunctional polynucleotide phosphatase kinase-like n=1 Tax=Lichtheimia corymbifera JMRC:FSU:9682 TaxID=1263082 RepID=A0A068SC96_9FUNG|nr:bifunctional polynucleotide phosphatase kinase-like [Lichtheimia corymbifera JMRC:FSU:9682]